jgi:predicted amidohydrolase YtcJ
MSFHYRALLPGVLAAALACAQADLVLTNGKVWTGVEQARLEQAVAIKDGKILATGSSIAMKKLAGAGTRVLDLQGKFAMPGFNDAHLHFSGGAERLAEVDLTGICTLPEIQKKIAEWAVAHPEAPWIRGGGWEYMCFPGNRLPTREDLDAAVSDRPAFLSAYDGHTAWANSKAMALAGLDKPYKYEGFGELVADAKTGVPTGCLKEGAQGLVRKLLPRRTPEERLKAIEAGVKYANSLGITSLQNASGNEEEVDLYETLQKAGKLTVRAAIAMSAGQMTTTQDVVDGWVELRKKHPGPWLKVAAVKFALDGVIESHTAAMLDLYADGSKTSGKLAWDEDAFRQALARVDKAGFQIYTHAIGDRAVRVALDGYEAVREANGKRDSRHRIEHIEVISPRDVSRFGTLGVMASMEPIHADPGTVAVWSKAVGEERVKLAFPWRSLEKAGAKLVFSSDWPASISLDPIRGIHSAVNRQTTDGKPKGGWLPEQRVSLETALRGYTTAAAYAEFAEGSKGMLKSGYLADLIVLDRNPFAIPTGELHTLKVEMTLVDGRIVFEK